MAAVVPHGDIMQVEATPVTGGTAHQHRRILNRISKDSIKITHEIPKSTFVDGCWQKTLKTIFPCLYWKCHCLDCYKDLAKQLEESEYTWVMENRIEMNRPMAQPKNEVCSICLCRWRVVDRPMVVYFDDDIMFEHMTLRKPLCHKFKTFCCGSWGETIQFRYLCACCPSEKLCGRSILKLKVTEGTGQECLDIIKKARENARAKMTTR